jgi:hypothetical protein
MVDNGCLLYFRWLELLGEPPEGFQAGQPGSSQQPPPPPPNLTEVMAWQTELLNQLVQAQMGHFQQQPRGRGEPLSASYQAFLSTQPPLFHKADEPLDADAWLRTIESKFALLPAPCVGVFTVSLPRDTLR